MIGVRNEIPLHSSSLERRDDRKGFDVLLEALERLLAEGLPVRLMVAGHIDQSIIAGRREVLEVISAVGRVGQGELASLLGKCALPRIAVAFGLFWNGCSGGNGLRTSSNCLGNGGSQAAGGGGSERIYRTGGGCFRVGSQDALVNSEQNNACWNVVGRADRC